MFVLNKKIIIGVIIVLVGVIIGANYIFRSDENIPDQVANSNNSGGGMTVIENPTAKPNPFAGKPLSELPKYAGLPLAEVRFGQGFSAPETAIEKKRGDLKVLAAVLSADPMGDAGVGDWIAVGVIKKFFNDFEGARDAWEYAGVLYPNNALSFANLGNLYAFYLHDNIKAEANFKKAIADDPYQPGYYANFADFYKNVYTAKKSEAIKVLLDGISKIKDVNLVLALATYYRDAGDKTNAIKYYEEVLKMSPGQAGIEEEISRLK